MSDSPFSPEQTAPQIPSPPLRLCSTIDAVEIERVAANLEAALYEHFLAFRARTRRFISPPQKTVVVMRWCSLIGLAATAGIWILGGLPPINTHQLEPFFLIFLPAA